MRNDRREIALLLASHFPTMAWDATSAEWGAFLDNITGIVTDPDEPNATAFDKWRQALAGQGFPVWGYSKTEVAAMQARGEELKQDEAERISKLPELLASLAKEAPLVTAAELLNLK